MTARQPFVAGNWKLNGSRSANARLLDGLLASRAGEPWAGMVEVAVCPPFVYLAEVAGRLAGSGVAVGAQDVAAEISGAYTGEVSAPMLRDCGCDYVIIGHSERRALYGETDALTARKVGAALAAGLKPILCVGETLEEREAGQTLAVVTRQLEAVMGPHGAKPFQAGVIAYEPVWAIGTGRTATPDQAQEVHAQIRALVARRDATIATAVRLLYGGSVKASNARDLFAMPDIDGGLIGGASLDAADFAAICRAAVA